MTLNYTDSELIDVVDEHDIVKFTLPRKLVHCLGMPHRSVQLFLYNKVGEIFVQLRSMSKEQFPGLFDVSVAGHVLTKESYIAALERECYEELGINLNSSLRKICKCQPSKENGFEFAEIYIMAIKGFMNPDSQEVMGGCWYDYRYLLDYAMEYPHYFVANFAHKLNCVATAI